MYSSLSNQLTPKKQKQKQKQKQKTLFEATQNINIPNIVKNKILRRGKEGYSSIKATYY